MIYCDRYFFLKNYARSLYGPNVIIFLAKNEFGQYCDQREYYV